MILASQAVASNYGVQAGWARAASTLELRDEQQPQAQPQARSSSYSLWLLVLQAQARGNPSASSHFFCPTQALVFPRLAKGDLASACPL